MGREVDGDTSFACACSASWRPHGMAQWSTSAGGGSAPFSRAWSSCATRSSPPTASPTACGAMSHPPTGCFERAVDAASSLAPPDAVRALDDALRLWRGPPYAEYAGES